MLREANKACKRFTYFMGYGCLVSGIIITAKPYLSDLYYSTIDDKPHIREVPFKGEFFYDVQNSPGYQLVYLLETFVSYFIIIFSVSNHLWLIKGQELIKSSLGHHGFSFQLLLFEHFYTF
jgi:hypothetical protein